MKSKFVDLILKKEIRIDNTKTKAVQELLQLLGVDVSEIGKHGVEKGVDTLGRDTSKHKGQYMRWLYPETKLIDKGDPVIV